MSIIHENARGEAKTSIVQEWDHVVAHRFLVEITEDDTGIYSAVALNLPGTGSCGDTRDEAIENFKEAAAGTIEYYADSGEEIPWKTIGSSETPVGAKWIRADA